MKFHSIGILLSAVTLPHLLANIAVAQDPPPQVAVLAPNGGEVLPANAETLVEYIGTDNYAVVRVELFSSIDGGQTWRPIAQPLRSRPDEYGGGRVGAPGSDSGPGRQAACRTPPCRRRATRPPGAKKSR